MNPKDFFKTAKFLNSHNAPEAHFRTSISRSYYGIYLYLRDYLNSHGICKIKSPGQQVHLFVRDVLQNSNSTEGSKLGETLGDLSQLRKDADYDLKKSFTFEDSEMALCMAQDAISDYDKIDSAEETKLLQNAKARAKFNWQS